jgi:hypothetical protein
VICTADRIPQTIKEVDTKYCVEVASSAAPPCPAMIMGGVILAEISNCDVIFPKCERTFLPTSIEHVETRAEEPGQLAYDHSSQKRALCAEFS